MSWSNLGAVRYGNPKILLFTIGLVHRLSATPCFLLDEMMQSAHSMTFLIELFFWLHFHKKGLLLWTWLIRTQPSHLITLFAQVSCNLLAYEPDFLLLLRYFHGFPDSG